MTDSGLSTTRSRLWGIVGTVLFHAVLLGLLALMVLDYNTRREEMLNELLAEAELEEDEDDETLLKPGEYVEVGDDFYEPASAPEETAPPSAAAKASAGSDNVLTTTVSSTIKAPARRDSVKAEARRRASERKAEQERAAQAKAIDERVQFGTAATGTPSDRKPGSVDGNVSGTGGALAGQPGANVKGRTLAKWTSPSATASGTITVAVRVDRKGRVTSATYRSGTGTVASSSAARNSCVQAALRSSFSVADDAPAEQTGQITYRFHAPK
ncbi:MAG: hypothetical protein NC187_07920 [Candidatus Amulumruptor caecigallinarius]|nr:hypothetical protein [Candidatus Amulumruptor caecigallinarius]MCM1397396.1 hypothetical protein [Candidatus Amulumruptor caecigallinarius]MCM1454481.1 hypothetical protein [bacterium]